MLIRHLLEQESKIPDKWEADHQDNSRLNIIRQLSSQWAFQEAEEIIYRLNSSNSEIIARNIISDCKDGLLEYKDTYWKFNVDPNYGRLTWENINSATLDSECILFQKIWDLIEKNKHSMTNSKQNYITKQIRKISDMKLQIRLETRLWHFSLPSKYWKRHPWWLYKNTSLYETRNVKHTK